MSASVGRPGPGDLSQEPVSEHDVPVRVTLLRPRGLLAGFHAEVADDAGVGIVEAGEQWAPTSLFIGSHRHDGWELYLQASGTSGWRAGTGAGARHWTLRPGAVLMVPPGVPHAMDGRPSDRHHFFFATIDLGPALTRRPALAAAWAMREPGLTAHGGALEAPFRRLIRELTAGPSHRRDGLELAVDALVLEATRLREGGSPAPALLHPAVLHARDLLDGGFRGSLTALAAAVGLSPSYLVERFTQDLGQTPHRYLAQRRLERAAELLARTDLPVTRIALDLGFASSSHLARSFRARYGRSPRAFRSDPNTP